MYQVSYKGKSIIAFSDTHGFHSQLEIPLSDFLIHCGDACTDGDLIQLKDFFKWFAMQPAKFKIFIAGNHDLPFDLEPEEAVNLVPPNVIYLENKMITLAGITFYSVPARPWLHELPASHKHINFLLTHGPAYSILDSDIGCNLLLSYIRKTPPVYHLFGHIHEHAQQKRVINKTTFCNVCIKNESN